MMHAFRPSVAKAFGVDEAIMLNNLIYWIKKNQANRKHFNDGRTWTYNSIEAFTEQFDYWTFKQIRRILDSLQKSGVIVVGRYNKKGYDKTKWYALEDEAMTDENYDFTAWKESHCPNGQIADPLPKWANGMPKRANQTAQKGQPIPDYKSDDIPYNVSITNVIESVEEIASEFDDFGEPTPTKIPIPPTPPKFRATPPKRPANEMYTLYEIWAKFAEAKHIPVSRTASGNYLFEPKNAAALKLWKTWVEGMPNYSGNLEADWEAFLEAAWTKGGKWIQANFTPVTLNSKRQEIVMAINRHKSDENAELLEFVENLRNDIDISDLV